MKSATNEIVIKSGKSVLHYWKDIWQQKELFWILSKRDVLVRYKQSVLGVAWSIIRPLLTTLVMFFAFAKIAKLDQTTTYPYILLVIPAVIIWLFFSQSLQNISNCIVGNTNLVAKVYFPRLLIAFSSLLVGLIDVFIAFLLFFACCLWYNFTPDWHIIFAPIFILLAYLAAFGFGLIAAVLNVRYRDIGQIIPFAVQFGYFASPIAYSVDSKKSEWWYQFYILNPVAGTVDGLRWSLLGGNAAFNWQSFIPLLIFVFVSLTFSIWFFRKNENAFVDYL